MQQANLEFRKIPSLQFLYEVNSNGTIIRNIKSKKQLKIKIDYHHSPKGYWHTFVNIKGKCIRVMVHKVVAECWIGPKPKGLQVDHIDRNSLNNDYRNLRYVDHSGQMKNRVLSQRIINQATKNITEYRKSIMVPCFVNGKEFESITSAARYIGEQLGINPESVRSKLKKRRSNVLGYDISYGMQRLDTPTLRSKE